MKDALVVVKNLCRASAGSDIKRKLGQSLATELTRWRKSADVADPDSEGLIVPESVDQWCANAFEDAVPAEMPLKCQGYGCIGCGEYLRDGTCAALALYTCREEPSVMAAL